VWVAAEGGNLCLIKNGVVEPGMASSGCNTAQEALEGKLISHSTTPSGTAVTVGLAPNGNASVLATEANGSSRTVSVNENVYEIVGKAPLAITLGDASGQSITAGVPGTWKRRTDGRRSATGAGRFPGSTVSRRPQLSSRAARTCGQADPHLT
jgi:hypothetical protein